MMKFLETAEDMAWLAEVHHTGAAAYACAILHGNEDAPERIELYARNHVACKPTVLQADANGDLRVMEWGEKPEG